MNQQIHTYKKKSGMDSDESITTSLTLFETDDGIFLKIKKLTSEKQPGGDFEETKREVLTIENLDVEVASTIRTTFNNWINSNSQPQLIKAFDGVDGVYEKTIRSTGPGRSPARNLAYGEGPAGEENNFDRLILMVGRQSISFQASERNDGLGVDIPSSEEVVRGHPQDVANIELVQQTFNDFFSIEFSDGVDDFIEVDSSELDEELAGLCISEFESGHYQSAVRTAFTVLEERIRDKGDFSQDIIGADLALQAFNSDGGELSFGMTKGEQDGVMFLYRGAFQALRNPVSHRFVDDVDEGYARDAIHTVNLLLRLLDENTE